MSDKNNTRGDILYDVLELQREIEEREDEINKLCDQAEKIEDKEDDEDRKKGYGTLSSILSHKTYR